MNGQCNFLKFCALQCKFFLMFAEAMQIFLFYALAMQFFFIFCTGNANLFFFCLSNADSFKLFHTQCKFFLIFALAMRLFFQHSPTRRFSRKKHNVFWGPNCRRLTYPYSTDKPINRDFFCVWAHPKHPISFKVQCNLTVDMVYIFRGQSFAV